MVAVRWVTHGLPGLNLSCSRTFSPAAAPLGRTVPVNVTLCPVLTAARLELMLTTHVEPACAAVRGSAAAPRASAPAAMSMRIAISSDPWAHPVGARAPGPMHGVRDLFAAVSSNSAIYGAVGILYLSHAPRGSTMASSPFELHVRPPGGGSDGGKAPQSRLGTR